MSDKRKPVVGTAMHAAIASKTGAVCEYYLLCTNPATMLVSHPVLPPVPTCDRCAAKHDLKGDPL
jgi:hypothetical protein